MGDYARSVKDATAGCQNAINQLQELYDFPTMSAVSSGHVEAACVALQDVMRDLQTDQNASPDTEHQE